MSIIRELSRLSVPVLLLGIVLLSEIFTLIMNSINSYIWWGRLDTDLLLIGTIDAFVVSGLVGGALIVLFRQIRSDHTLIQEEKNKAESIISAIGSALCIMDRDFRVTYQNELHTTMCGRNVGNRCYQAFHKRDTICESCPVEAAMNDGKTHVFEKVSHSGGQRRYTELTASPVISNDGDITGAVEIIRDITDRKNMEHALRQSLEDKDMLIKEVHHRVKNNLAVLQSLLNLQSHELSDTGARDKLRESQDRVRSMALLHERLYRSGTFTTLNIRSYLESLTVPLLESYKSDTSRVSFRNDIPDTEMDIDTAIPLGLIVNELVTNACKYAFPNGRSGEIALRLRPTGHRTYELSVQDTGAGLPSDFDLATARSLGMQIVTALARQLEGNIQTYNGVGTEFRLTFREKGLSDK